MVLKLATLVWHMVEADPSNCAAADGARNLGRAVLLHRLLHVASRARNDIKALPVATAQAARWVTLRGGLDEVGFSDPLSLIQSLGGAVEISRCITLLTGMDAQEAIRPTALTRELTRQALDLAIERRNQVKEGAELLSLRGACLKAGVPLGRARGLKRRGKLKPTSIVRGSSGESRPLFDPKDFDALRELRWPGRIAVPLLGISRESLVAMRRSGLLHRESGELAVFGCTAEAGALLGRLQGIARPSPRDGRVLVCLGSDAFWRWNMWRCVGLLVEDALCGRVPVYLSQEGVGFQRLFMDATLLRAAQRVSLGLRIGNPLVAGQFQLFDELSVRVEGGRVGCGGWRSAIGDLRQSLDVRVRSDRPLFWRRRSQQSQMLPSAQLELWGADVMERRGLGSYAG